MNVMSDDLVEEARAICKCSIDDFPCGAEYECRITLKLCDRIEELENITTSDYHEGLEEGIKIGRKEKENETQWQPIETAPKDRPILVSGGKVNNELGGCWKNDGWVKVYWDNEDWQEPEKRWQVCDTCYYGVWVENPTHWMPLPEPPKEKNDGN
jgi:hypothetical protein